MTYNYFGRTEIPIAFEYDCGDGSTEVLVTQKSTTTTTTT
jgi:hypothetical protein